MPLLVIQILQLEMERIDLLARLGCHLLGASDLQNCIPVEPAQLRQVSVELLLLPREQELDVMWGVLRRGDRIRIGKVDELKALLACLSGGFKHSLEKRVGYYGAAAHDGRSVWKEWWVVQGFQLERCFHMRRGRNCPRSNSSPNRLAWYRVKPDPP